MAREGTTAGGIAMKSHVIAMMAHGIAMVTHGQHHGIAMVTHNRQRRGIAMEMSKYAHPGTRGHNVSSGLSFPNPQRITWICKLPCAFIGNSALDRPR